MNNTALGDNEDKYLKGATNRGIRYYFYLSNGLGILNEFRNLFLGILALYITFKLTSIPFLIGLFIVAIIGLTVTGYYIIHHVAKVKEWLSMRFGTHFGIQAFDYQKQTYELLLEIRDLLKESNKVEIINKPVPNFHAQDPFTRPHYETNKEHLI